MVSAEFDRTRRSGRAGDGMESTSSDSASLALAEALAPAPAGVDARASAALGTKFAFAYTAMVPLSASVSLLRSPSPSPSRTAYVGPGLWGRRGCQGDDTARQTASIPHPDHPKGGGCGLKGSDAPISARTRTLSGTVRGRYGVLVAHDQTDHTRTSMFALEPPLGGRYSDDSTARVREGENREKRR